MSWLVASMGSAGIPSDRAKTFAEPPGTTATGDRLRDLGGVAAVVGVLDDQVESALQRVGQQVTPRSGGGGGVGVDDQHGTHDAPVYGIGVATLTSVDTVAPVPDVVPGVVRSAGL